MHRSRTLLMSKPFQFEPFHAGIIVADPDTNPGPVSAVQNNSCSIQTVMAIDFGCRQPHIMPGVCIGAINRHQSLAVATLKRTIVVTDTDFTPVLPYQITVTCIFPGLNAGKGPPYSVTPIHMILSSWFLDFYLIIFEYIEYIEFLLAYFQLVTLADIFGKFCALERGYYTPSLYRDCTSAV